MCLKVLIDASKTYDSVLEKFEKWVDIENRLLKMDETCCTYEQIAEALPARSRDSVRAKLQRLKRENREDTYIGGRGSTRTEASPEAQQIYDELILALLDEFRKVRGTLPNG